ncbi:Mov34/MPN/PAD-1 family protein [[Eubacterium] cellulosolvens]
MGWFSHKEKPESNNEDVPDRSHNSQVKQDRKPRKVWGIKKAMIEFIIEASKDSYPNEFYAKLLQKNGVITEFSIIRTIQGRTHAIPFTYMDPPDIFLETAGTVHSHPSGNNQPSGADLEFFRKMGSTHIIIGYPYTETTWQAYDIAGRPIELKVVRRVK